MNAQNTCEMGFVRDSLFVEKDNAFVGADGLITPLFKDGGQVKIFKVGNKYYLMLTCKSNLFFDVINDLEIKSGTKSMVAKGVKQHQKDKYTGFFVVEILRNYVATLKDNGITSYVFNTKETLLVKMKLKKLKNSKLFLSNNKCTE
ncbi:MAG: hypothetical protein IPJ60_12145 [Sphingobacteriaceae bacterium]|nr:hypothetical protein [Sphingobacteriaceae bacterium]